MTDNAIMILDEDVIRDMVYEIRGQRVMLDFDLARIYGYETKRLNEQVNRNSDRFPQEFMFQLTREETDDLVKSNIMISRETPMFTGQFGGVRHLPYAFTEQGIYMLMTVLKGEVAVQQSIMLIRIFKKLKDRYLLEPSLPDPIEMAKSIESHEKAIVKNKKKILSQGKKIGAIQTKLHVIMKELGNPYQEKEYVFLANERVEAAIAYREIYSHAEHSILIVDNYISAKTLGLLKSAKAGVGVTLLSDNQSKPKIEQSDLDDFLADTGNAIVLKPTNDLIHDRYIVIDYGFPNEEVYLCGPSSKDAGRKAGSILQAENPQDFHRLFDQAL